MTNSQQQRSVSFNDAVLGIDTLHVNNYTDEEVFNTWFTQREYKEMKREIKVTVAMIENKSNFAEGVNFSSRGLEDKTADTIVQKVEHRYFAMDAVLDEQDRQQDAGICDPHKLSLVYTEYSFISHMAAFLMAATDEKIALRHGSSSSSGSRQKETLTSPKAYPKACRIAPRQQVSKTRPPIGLFKRSSTVTLPWMPYWTNKTVNERPVVSATRIH
jgi:hypothetical protein